MKYTFLAVVVVYKPNVELLIQNISQFINEVDMVVIWENSYFEEQVIIDHFKTDKIVFMGSGKNIGIGAAVNSVIKEYPNYDYIMTMDQDSVLLNCKSYFSQIISRFGKKEIYGPQIVGEIITEYAANDIEVDHVITSGCVVRCSLLDEIGGLNESLFIDAVDEEMCYRAKEYGYKIIQIKNGVLRQKYGIPEIRRFLWKKIVVSDYSPIRMYYSSRNHLYLMKRFNMDSSIKYKLLLKYIIRPFAETILYHNDKITKIKYLIMGIVDAHNNVLGQFEDNNVL